MKKQSKNPMFHNYFLLCASWACSEEPNHCSLSHLFSLSQWREMKGSLPASCQCQLAQVRGHESIQHSPVAAIRSMLIALMIIVTFTTTTLQVTAFEDSQIRFVKGRVKPMSCMRGKHVHSIAVNVKSQQCFYIGAMLEDCPQNNIT